MPRGPRNAPGGYVYHALNRGVGRGTLFFKPADFDAFERILLEALEEVPSRVLGYCLMPNHFHLLLWPREDGELSAFMRWLTNTHTQRWHAHYHTSGTGHVYQGRFKSFPVQSDPHLLIVARYIERNALRAGFVERAEQWHWCSLWRRQCGQDGMLRNHWPVERPEDWVKFVNEPQGKEELEMLRRSVRRSCPFGADDWQLATARALNLARTLRPQGRPRRTAKHRRRDETGEIDVRPV
jgi:putative transposase